MKRRNRELLAALPVLPGAATALEAALAGLGQGPGSPFAAVPGTHIARLGMLGRVPDLADSEQAGTWVVFCGVFDGDREAWARALLKHAGPACDELFGHCAGWPGTAVPEAGVRWLMSHRLSAGFSIEPYAHARLGDVQDALAAQERLTDFVVSHQDASDAEIASDFRKAFG